MSARFAQPLYDGDDATVEFDPGAGTLTARNSAGDVLAKGKARFVIVRQAHPGGEPEKKSLTA